MISHQVYYLAGASGFDDEILSQLHMDQLLVLLHL